MASREVIQYEGWPSKMFKWFSVVFIAFPGADGVYQPLIWAMAVLTMTFGNVLALRQTNIVRMLAYSGIAQAGIATRFRIVGIPDEYTVTGSQADIFRHYGLTMEGLAATAQEHGIAGAQAQRRRISGHVGTAFIDHPDHAQRARRPADQFADLFEQRDADRVVVYKRAGFAVRADGTAQDNGRFNFDTLLF